MFTELKNAALRAFETTVFLFGTAFSALAQDAPEPMAWSEADLIQCFSATKQNIDTSDTSAAIDTSGRFGFKVDKVHTLPVYPGCESAGSTREAQFSCLNRMIQTLIARNVRYPEMARQQLMQGNVWIAFVIDTEGYADEVWVQRSVDPLLDAEALRVMKMLPRMKPATVDGKPVNLRYTIPINFRLK
jgi:TonB family protein